MHEKKDIIIVKDEKPIELDKRVGTPLTNPVYFFQKIPDLTNFTLDKENLEISSIIEKLETYKSDDLIEIKDDHLDVIESVKYFFNILNQVEAIVNNNIWGMDENMDAKECNIDLEFIKKIVRIPLNDIKDYWKEYDEEQEEIQKQKLEKIENLNLTQFSELCLNLLKKVIGGSVEKSNNEYLADLIDNYDVDIPK